MTENAKEVTTIPPIPVTSNAAAGYPHPSFAEGYQRRGELLRRAQIHLGVVSNMSSPVYQLCQEIKAELKEG